MRFIKDLQYTIQFVSLIVDIVLLVNEIKQSISSGNISNSLYLRFGLVIGTIILQNFVLLFKYVNFFVAAYITKDKDKVKEIITEILGGSTDLQKPVNKPDSTATLIQGCILRVVVYILIVSF